MSLKSCFRLVRSSSTLPLVQSVRRSSLLPPSSSSSRLVFHPLRSSSTVSPIFAEYHRKRKKEWQKPRHKKEEEEEKKKKGAAAAEENRENEKTDNNASGASSAAAEAAAAAAAATAASKLPPDHLLYTIPELVPTTYWGHRDSVREALERVDLAKRRATLKVPEFYVGSILSVTVADNYSPTKQTKFVGICISKGEPGLRHRFTLRNVIDDQGVEIMYELYNPMIRDITVLKLVKRLDDELLYLRDALPEYSTVPFDMKPVPRSASEAIPLSKILVKMKPKPWTHKWERKGFKGIDESTIMSQLDEKERFQRLEPTRNMMWQKYDLAVQYRNSVTREETDAIYEDVERFDRHKEADSRPDEERVTITRRKARRVT